MEAEPPKRDRHWFQFSLRTPMFVVSIVSIQCAASLPIWPEGELR
jgi:hypothetical protein